MTARRLSDDALRARLVAAVEARGPALARILAQTERVRAALREHASVQPPPLRSPLVERILVVDDDPDTTAALRDVLGQLCVAPVDVVHDGATALAHAHVRQYGVVVLDLVLPDTTGVELADRLREARGTAAAALIVLTAVAENAALIKRRTGAHAVVVKPCRAHTLAELVRGLYPTKRAIP